MPEPIPSRATSHGPRLLDPLAHAPRALLLDFGGVLFETSKHPSGRDDMVRYLADRLARAGHPVAEPRLRASLDAALTALKHWKHASSRRLAPREMPHREIVGDFLAADLSEPARELLVAEAGEVLDVMSTTLSDHRLRPGVRLLLETAAEQGIRVGVVSNAHSGRSHRRLMDEHGLEPLVGVQVYSDEVGVRKPNPRMIQLATEALGVPAEQCWYVGDTWDRDVVVGRRAGVGAVLLTRAQHTDSPPFAVSERPDAVHDTPEGVLADLRRATASTPAGWSEAPGPHEPLVVSKVGRSAPVQRRRPVLLIDHGGVISLGGKDPAALSEFASWLAHLLERPEDPRQHRLHGPAVQRLVAAGRERYAEFKRQELAAGRRGGPVREISPRQFWVEHVGAGLTPRQRAVLEAEADSVMWRYARVKSTRTLRPGIEELLRHCRSHRVGVVVVSNTMSGRVVREECARHGLAELIDASVCSDEIGVRKPDRRIVDAAVRLSWADVDHSWFLGDKPHTDAVAARAAGIARRVLVRGGSTPDHELVVALERGLATDLVAVPGDLVALMGTSTTAAGAPEPPQHDHHPPHPTPHVRSTR